MEDLQSNFKSKFINLKQAFISIVVVTIVCVGISLLITQRQGHYYTSKVLIQVGSYPNYQEGELPTLIEPLTIIEERVQTPSYIKKMISLGALNDSKLFEQVEKSLSVHELKTRGMLEIQLSAQDEQAARTLMEKIALDIELRHKDQFASAFARSQKYLEDIRNETKRSHEVVDELMKKNDKDPNYISALMYAFANQSALASLLNKLELTQNVELYHTARIADVSVSKDQFYKNLKTNIEIAIILGLMLGLLIHYLFCSMKKSSN